MSLLRNKTIIVTGAGGNIGQAYCRGFLEMGANVVAADLNDIGTEAAKWGHADRLMTIAANVLSQPDCDRVAEETVRRFHRIDGLLNNAGFFKSASFGSFLDIPPEEWDLCYQVNVRGTWQSIKAVHAQMKRQGQGSIVNISSNTPYKGVPNFLHYVSSKAAIVGLSRSLAREVGGDGILVNTLCPDLIPDGDIVARQGSAADERTIAGRCLKRTQFPEDMVGAAAFLFSDLAGFITGQSLLVNGGAHFN
ncbi:SDR family NAD(P)-dependent oxidoreductase [Mesorhizobium sp. NPDC059054]|uniref:SDR family NAD(P)-dependent oxidoreductase n=1 Tax=Mesorhizobium sp. NPDC059054 TaxID=3346711 RepID=UPI00368FE11C